MKVKLNATEVITYALVIEIEVEGEKCEARVSYDIGNGYEVDFYTLQGEPMSWPQWALDKQEASNHSLGYELESAVGGWFQWVKEEASK
jgi:hypothetical protein